MLQLSFYKEISGVIVMCLDERAAQALLCAHAEQKNVQEIAPLGLEHESVHIHHHLSFLTVGNRPSCSTKVGKKDANSLFWLLRHFGALRKRSALLYTFEPCWGAEKSLPSASIALAKREQVWECSAGS